MEEKRTAGTYAYRISLFSVDAICHDIVFSYLPAILECVHSVSVSRFNSKLRLAHQYT